MRLRDHVRSETILTLILGMALWAPHALGQLLGLPKSDTDTSTTRTRGFSGSTERTFAVVSADARKTLGAQAVARRNGNWPAWERATRRLVQLNDELRYHSRNQDGSQLARLKKTIVGRLRQAKQTLALDARTPQSTQDTLGPFSDTLPDSLLRVLPIEHQLLAQQVQLPVQQGAAVGGGFGGNAGPAAGQGALPADYADDLIALIEGTISADIWQSVGGPASISYYQPSLALVISAPGDVHDGVVDLLYQLRRASGP